MNIKTIFTRFDLPLWFVWLNYISLVPVAAWPFVLFGSVFMADNPKNVELTFIYIILLDCYPLYLIGLVLLSYKLFATHKTIAVTLPLIPIILFIYLIYQFFAVAVCG